MSAQRGAAVAFELPSDASVIVALHNTVKRLDLFVGGSGLECCCCCYCVRLSAITRSLSLNERRGHDQVDVMSLMTKKVKYTQVDRSHG